MSAASAADELTREARQTLEAVLDAVVPPRPDGSLPGAGALGLGEPIAAALAPDAEARAALAASLAALDALARPRDPGGFAALDAAGRQDALESFAAAEPGFLPGLVFHTYTHYYRHPRVVEALGLEAWPPHPKGYPLETGDLSLLDAVRARAPFYRGSPRR